MDPTSSWSSHRNSDQSPDDQHISYTDADNRSPNKPDDLAELFREQIHNRGVRHLRNSQSTGQLLQQQGNRYRALCHTSQAGELASAQPARSFNKLRNISDDDPLRIVIAAAEGAQSRRVTPKSGNFNIYCALLQNREVLAVFSTNLGAEQFVNLYSICRAFHGFVKSQHTAALVANVRNMAPESGRVFHFKRLDTIRTISPLMRINQFLTKATGTNEPDTRAVPTLKWLQMIHHREKVVESIMFELAEAGHRLPKRASRVIKKLWILMDVPVTQGRVSLMQDQNFFSDSDLFVAAMFFIKLDMRFNDALNEKANSTIREMMMAQKTMTVLDEVLRRKEMRTRYRALQMYMQLEPEVEEEAVGHNPTRRINIFGVPEQNIGQLRDENWTRGGEPLRRLDELVVREAVRRDLDLDRWLLDMMLWGYVNQQSGKDIWPPSAELGVCEATKIIGFDRLPEWAKNVETDGSCGKIEPWKQYQDGASLGPQLEDFVLNSVRPETYMKNKHMSDQNATGLES